jgi:two-component system sensor histidine kinase HydH
MDRPKIFRPEAQDASGHRPDHDPSSRHQPATGQFVVGKPKLAWTDVRHIVDELCRQFGPRMRSVGIALALDMPRELVALADAEMLSLALAHLLTNAIEAMPTGGQLEITSYFGKGGLELEIADSGPGLSDMARARAFEPHFTTKRHAAGLGLAQARRIAQAHGGDIVAANCPEGGAAFTLRVPGGARQAAA